MIRFASHCLHVASLAMAGTRRQEHRLDAGVALFGLTVWLSQFALARWHESEVTPAD